MCRTLEDGCVHSQRRTTKQQKNSKMSNANNTWGEAIDILLLSSHAIKPHSNVLFTYIDLYSSPPRLVKLCIAVDYG